MTKKRVLATLLLLALFSTVLVSCATNNDSPFVPGYSDDNPTGPYDPYQKDSGIKDETGGQEIEVKIDDDVTIDETEIGKITDLTVDGIGYDETNKVFNITKAGEFIFKGEFEGNILVHAGDDDDVKITLNGFTIKSTTDSPIKCVNANELQVSVKKGSENFVYDNRTIKVEDNDEQGNGAITSNCDLKLSGKGSLVIVANYNNGIHTKDDLSIKPEVENNSSIQIKAVNNCLKGNDSIKIESGNLVLISTFGNAIKTENTDISSKGKQRGTISITGGQLDIYSAKDAIEASYNVEISKAGDSDPVINIYTSNYSEYSGEVADTNESKLYIKTSSNIGNYYFAVEYINSDYTTSWARATKVNSQGGFDRSYYYETTKPVDATALKVCLFANDITTMSEANAISKMNNYVTLNSNYDTIDLSASTSSITANRWTSYQTTQRGGPGGFGPGGMSEGNTDKADYSAKGIKAENEINISGGIFFIKTYDDAIHANYGETLENGSTGLGNINISGGTFTIYSSDDAIHADNTLTISGGNIEIKKAYEGLEANFININDGYTKIYAIDDGINASKKINQTPKITVSGGVVDVTVNGQDVDGIDSNGSYLQTGGIVITKGATGGMSTGLDCDGSATINGGTFIAFGQTEKTPTKGSGVVGYTLSSTYSAGNYTIVFPDETTLDTTTIYSYRQVIVYSNNQNKITVDKK